MTNAPITTKADLLTQLEQDWQAINALLVPLSDEQWTTIHDDAGWTIKDHVAHLIAWEQSVIAFLNGKPRYEALGVSKAVYRSKDIDAVNHIIFQQRQAMPLADVREQFQSTHAALLKALEPLSDADLNQPSSYFLEEAVIDGEGPPAIQIVDSSTGFHFQEHHPWIKAMLDNE